MRGNLTATPIIFQNPRVLVHSPSCSRVSSSTSGTLAEFAHLDEGDAVIALYPLLEGRVETSPAVRPRYCYMVSTSPLTVSLDLTYSLHPSLGRVIWWFQPGGGDATKPSHIAR